MITVKSLIKQLAKFPRGAKIEIVQDTLLIRLKEYTGAIHCPVKGRQRKMDMGEFAGWTDMITEPDCRVNTWLSLCPEQAHDLALEAVLNLYMENGAPWLGTQTDFPSGADYIDEMTRAMERVGLKPLIQELQDEADEREEEE